MLLTCANLANLRLSETLRRQSELDTRLALGSGTGGLVKLLLVENLLVGLVGAVLAIALAWVLTTSLGKTLLAGGALERIYWVEARLDSSVVLLALGLTFAATLLGAFAPIASTILGARSRSLGHGASPSRQSWWTRGLVSAQVGICFALLVAAGLFGARARDLLDVAPGFRPDHLSSLLLSTYQAGLDEKARRDFFERLENELPLEAEITSAAVASSPPWGYVPRRPVGLDTDPDPERSPPAKMLEVSPRFFETLELPLLAGRGFDESGSRRPNPETVEAEDPGFGVTSQLDRPLESDAAILSRSLAERLDRFDSSPLDRTITIGGQRPGAPIRRARVIGIVADLDVARADEADRNFHVYLPSGYGELSSFVLVRTAPGIAGARPTVERLLSRVAPQIGILDELGVEKALASSVWVERRLGQIFSLFGLAALLLTAVGMYAVIAVMVRSRQRELGIRAAIGAGPEDLMMLVLGESAAQLLLGLVAGAGALWAANQWLDSDIVASLHSGVGVAGSHAAQGHSLQLPVFLSTAAIVTVCCLSAVWGPVSRAARTDPTRSLRSE